MSYKLTHNAIHTTTCSGLTKFALIALADYADENGECYPAQTTLAKLLGCSRQAVVKAIKNLEEQGLIVREGWKNRAAKYRLVLSKSASDDANDLSTTVTSQPTTCQPSLQVPVNVVYKSPATCQPSLQVPVNVVDTNISLNRSYNSASKPAALNDILATLAEEYARGKSPAQAAVVRELKNLEAFPPKQRERIKRLAASDFEGVCDRLGYIRPIFGEAVAASLAAPADPLADIDKQLEAIKRGQNDDPLKDIDKQLEAIKRRREGGAL